MKKKFTSLYTVMKERNLDEIKEIIEYARSKSLSRVPGYVYFISDGTYVKIGKTTNILKRLSALQTANGRPLRILGVAFPDMDQTAKELEDELHFRYHKRNVGGEHYRLDDADVISSCDVILANYYCHRIVGEHEYYDWENKRKITLMEAIDPNKMRDRIFSGHTKYVYGSECLVGLDSDMRIWSISNLDNRCCITDKVAESIYDVKEPKYKCKTV